MGFACASAALALNGVRVCCCSYYYYCCCYFYYYYCCCCCCCYCYYYYSYINGRAVCSFAHLHYFASSSLHNGVGEGVESLRIIFAAILGDMPEDRCA